jgi:hypothetical protein
MTKLWLVGLLALAVPVSGWAEDPLRFRPATPDFGRVSTPQLGAAPRIGSFASSTPFQSNLIDTTNTIVPIGMASSPFGQPQSGNAFFRTMQTLFPFLVKASATAAFPEGAIIQQAIPKVTIK